jgi:hypothetical protein
VCCPTNDLRKSRRQSAPCSVARLTGCPTLSRLAPCLAPISPDFHRQRWYPCL